MSMFLGAGLALLAIVPTVPAPGMAVLIVDDDNDINFDDDQSIDVFRNMLENMSYTVTVEDAPSTDNSTWENYDFVVWSCGDDIVPVLDEAYKLALIDHVNGGGRLIIESGNIAYDLDTQSRPSGDLFRDTVLHATSDWIYSDVDDMTVKDGGHPVASIPNPLPATIPFTETNPGDYSGDADAVRCYADAVGVCGWSGLRWAGSPPIPSVIAACNSIIAYDDDADVNNGGQTVYLTIDIDDIDSAGTQNDLVENAVRWVASVTPENDVGVDSIDAPLDQGSYPAGARQVNATVKNYGTASQSNFDVSCEIIEVVQQGSYTALLSEDFDEGGALPAGWDNSTYTWRDWRSTTDSGRYGEIVGGADYGFVCDSDRAGSGAVDSWLESAPADCSGYGVVELNFTHRYNWYGETEPEGIYVYVATDGSLDVADDVVFHSAGPDIALTTESINISAYAAGQADVRVGFRYVADYDYWWVVDDVLVSGIVPHVEKTVFGPENRTVTAVLAQNDTAPVNWTYSFPNATDYRIIVRTWLAGDEDQWNDEQSILIHVTGGLYSIDLVEGWNFISLPYVQADTALATVLASVDGQYDAVQFFNSTAQEWRQYTTFKGGLGDTLADIDHTMGFWINVTSPGTLDVTGTLPTGARHLVKGWNMVGYNRLVPRPVSEVFSAANFTGEYAKVETVAVQGAGGLVDAINMQPGWGYWVYVTQEGDWSI